MVESDEQASLLVQAGQALARNQPVVALGLLDRADALGPSHNGFMSRSIAYRLLGDFQSAIRVLDQALDLQPYDFMALLAKGAMVEKVAGQRAAVPIYRDALKISPPRDHIPPAAVAQMDYAAALVKTHANALCQFMQSEVAALKEGLDESIRDRFDESLEIYAGLKQPVKQQPLLLNYPRLPVIPFYDRTLFPWLSELEAATEAIQSELSALVEDVSDAFVPYIAFPTGAPVNQWGELNHSRKWTSLFLWKDGEKQQQMCDRCPQTTRVLESLPMAHQDGFGPTAVFSALQPHTHIPPHTGSSNVRLLAHLPLRLPGPARFRVGNTTREWKIGEAWVFDDTIEHEAWNDADDVRIILIIDVWNPYLTDKEKQLITAMMKAQRAYMAG